MAAMRKAALAGLLAVMVVVVVAAAAAVADAEEVSRPAKVAFPYELNPVVFKTMLADMRVTSSKSSAKLRLEMGNQVNNKGYTNTCVIRVSHAWNAAAKAHPKSWAQIPGPADTKYPRDQSLYENGGNADRGDKTGEVYVVRDKLNQNVALRVKEMHDWLAAVWGKPTHTNKAEIKADASLSGVIFFLDCKWGASSATGHMDLYHNRECANSCYWDDCATVKVYAASGDVRCTVRGKNGRVNGVCRDQELCVLAAESKPYNNWPVVETGQCPDMGSRVKCCVKEYDLP